MPVDLKVIVVPQVNEGRVVHFDHPRLPADLEVEHGEGRVTDPAHFADRERVHDDFGRLQHIHVGADEVQRHRGGHRGEQIGLDSAAEAVGKSGEVTVFRLQPFEQDVVSADVLPVVDQLAALHFDKYIVRHFRSAHFLISA
ncbi:hypothetical protein SDC9_188951 [bioreactor metagenome]|uniref:Uncharacterized protein n=1 Tax=bioreactor metagenome TaxID=1076179 RepID=A0A645HQR5_9ZZZZ